MAKEYWLLLHVPKEHRARVREELYKQLTADDILRLKRARWTKWMWIVGMLGVFTILHFSPFRMWGLTVITTLFAVHFIIDSLTDDMSGSWHQAKRLTAAVRAAGLEANDPTRPAGVKAHIACLMPPTPHRVRRDWDWVSRGRAIARQRLVHKDLLDFDDILKHRRKRLRLYGCLFLVLIWIVLFTTLSSPLLQYASHKNDPAFDDLVDIILTAYLALGFILCIGYALFYTIHERWRPTWAALNALNAPTCMHCGHDLRSLNAEGCPECGAPTDQYEMQQILLLDHIVNPEPSEETTETDDAAHTPDNTELDWQEQELLDSYLD